VEDRSNRPLSARCENGFISFEERTARACEQYVQADGCKRDADAIRFGLFHLDVGYC
jgi:hypothetical protein